MNRTNELEVNMSKIFYVDKSIAEGTRKQGYPFAVYAHPNAKRARVCLTDEDAQRIVQWHNEQRVPPKRDPAAAMITSSKMPTHMIVEEEQSGSTLRALVPWPGLSDKQEQACRDLEYALMKCELAGVVIAVMDSELVVTTEENMQRVGDVMVKSMLRGHGELYKATHPPFGRKLDDHGRLGWHGDW